MDAELFSLGSARAEIVQIARGRAKTVGQTLQIESEFACHVRMPCSAMINLSNQPSDTIVKHVARLVWTSEIAYNTGYTTINCEIKHRMSTRTQRLQQVASSQPNDGNHERTVQWWRWESEWRRRIVAVWSSRIGQQERDAVRVVAEPFASRPVQERHLQQEHCRNQPTTDEIRNFSGHVHMHPQD